MSRVTKLPDGRYENLHREVVYYLDLKEDRILEEWENPYTGETVKPFPTHNDPVNSYYATHVQTTFRHAKKRELKPSNFRSCCRGKPFGDRAVVSFSVNTRWPTPLPEEKWPREHFGPVVSHE